MIFRQATIFGCFKSFITLICIKLSSLLWQPACLGVVIFWQCSRILYYPARCLFFLSLIILTVLIGFDDLHNSILTVKGGALKERHLIIFKFYLYAINLSYQYQHETILVTGQKTWFVQLIKGVRLCIDRIILIWENILIKYKQVKKYINTNRYLYIWNEKRDQSPWNRSYDAWTLPMDQLSH